MHVMKRFAATTALAVVVLGSGVAWAADPEVKVSNGHLTDTKGMALYTFKKDTEGKSVCAGDCVQKWPLYHQDKVGVTGDLKASDFTTITREDGKKQTAYKGKPLYYFAGDKAPGDTKGDGVKDVWELAKP
jgi:predicted lipoprotein with Yx(FWY)xxD motif